MSDGRSIMAHRRSNGSVYVIIDRVGKSQIGHELTPGYEGRREIRTSPFDVCIGVLDHCHLADLLKSQDPVEFISDNRWS